MGFIVFQSGKLQIFDIGSGSLLEEITAHTGAVWSICMSPDKVSDPRIFYKMMHFSMYMY